MYKLIVVTVERASNPRAPVSALGRGTKGRINHQCSATAGATEREQTRTRGASIQRPQAQTIYLCNSKASVTGHRQAVLTRPRFHFRSFDLNYQRAGSTFRSSILPIYRKLQVDSILIGLGLVPNLSLAESGLGIELSLRVNLVNQSHYGTYHKDLVLRTERNAYVASL